MMTTTIIAAVVCALAWATLWTIKQKARNAERSLRGREMFYEEAMKLLEDDDIPDDVHRWLATLCRNVVKKRPVYFLAWTAARGRLGAHNATRARRGDDAFASMLNKLSPQQQTIFIKAFAYFIMMVTYNSLIVGSFVRRFILWSVDMDNPNPSDTRRIAEEQIGHYDGNGMSVAA